MEQNLLSNTVQAVQNSMNNFVVAVFEILYDRKVIQIVQQFKLDFAALANMLEELKLKNQISVTFKI